LSINELRACPLTAFLPLLPGLCPNCAHLWRQVGNSLPLGWVREIRQSNSEGSACKPMWRFYPYIKKTGFRVKPGMTDLIGLLEICAKIYVVLYRRIMGALRVWYHRSEGLHPAQWCKFFPQN
jgi:hypothetical protein